MHQVTFYISGHGYGHATRSLELIKELSRRNAELFFHIKTDAPRWMFELNLQSNYRLHPLSWEVGTMQKDSFRVDISETYRQCQALLERLPGLIDQEVAFARELKPRMILSDIPSWAFEVARAVETFGVGLANFSWDWIYEPYLDSLPQFASIIERIRAAYGHADLLMRLPFSGDLSAFPTVVSIPLIARRAKTPPEQVRERIGFTRGDGKRLVLVALRASDLHTVNLDALASLPGLTFVTFGLGRTLHNSIDLPPNFMPFPELVNASDLVISKPGYGIVSEIIAHRKPLLYISRDDFREYPLLVDGLQRFAVVCELPRGDFFAGRWGPHVEALMARPGRWPSIPVDGAAKAADLLMTRLVGEKTE